MVSSHLYCSYIVFSVVKYTDSHCHFCFTILSILRSFLKKNIYACTKYRVDDVTYFIAPVYDLQYTASLLLIYCI
jgi:hypothetical protein